MLRFASILAFLSIAAGAHSREYMGQRVLNMPFAIAGGKVITLPTTDAGPIPAEDRKVRIDLAGFNVSPSKDDPKQAVLVWGFGFTNKSMKDIESVVVTEVAPTNVEIVLVNDASPSLHNDYWQGSTSPVAITSESTPWLFTEGASIYVFRFTINERNKAPRVLYQPAWFSAEVKAKFRQMVESIKKADNSLERTRGG